MIDGLSMVNYGLTTTTPAFTANDEKLTTNGSEQKNGKVYLSLANPASDDEMLAFEGDALEMPYEEKATMKLTSTASEKFDVDELTRIVTVSTDIDSPREVTVTNGVTEDQQAAIDEAVDKAKNDDCGFKDLQVSDNVLYKDEDGKPIKQVVTKTNEKGDKVVTTVYYDSEGRVSRVTTTGVNHHGYLKEAYEIQYKYLENGNVLELRNDHEGFYDYRRINLPVIITSDGERHLLPPRRRPPFLRLYKDPSLLYDVRGLGLQELKAENTDDKLL